MTIITDTRRPTTGSLSPAPATLHCSSETAALLGSAPR